MLIDYKAGIVANLIRANVAKPPTRVLVVGCGTGREAAQLAIALGADVTGIDIAPRFDPAAGAIATLRQGDATAMDFPDGAFDLVYSYHALEHIPDFRRALREMRRVLAKDGSYFIGTPNRSRVVGYLGSEGTSLRKKLLWNANDWSARLRGKFRNEYGAHAGYTRTELQNELSAAIGPAKNLTLPYYLAVYAGKARYVRLLDQLGVSSLLFPAIYFIGRRGVTTSAEIVSREVAVQSMR